MGCGVCAAVCPEGNIALRDVEAEGIRPFVNQDGCKRCGGCVSVCPGHSAPQGFGVATQGVIQSLLRDWGQVLEVWEGYAQEEAVRHFGSSGGAATALACFALESGEAKSVVQIGQDPDLPVRNRTFVSRSQEELFAHTGSRYSPASPGDALGLMGPQGGPWLFIGKPCDVQGLRKAQREVEAIRERMTLAISIFCAGTPATRGLMELLRSMRVDPGSIEALRFRGKGWPGCFEVKTKDNHLNTLPYEKAWGFLQAYRPYRCHLCPDGTGQFADISCGDPWYRPRAENEAGYSLILVRSNRGRQFMKEAIEAGFIKAWKVDPEVVPLSQPSMAAKRGAIWGRLLAMKIFGIPRPLYPGFPLFESWVRLSAMEKVRSVLGTARRILTRGYYRRGAET